MRGPRAHCPGAAGGLAAGAVVAGREAELEAGARWVGTTAERPHKNIFRRRRANRFMLCGFVTYSRLTPRGGPPAPPSALMPHISHARRP